MYVVDGRVLFPNIPVVVESDGDLSTNGPLADKVLVRGIVPVYTPVRLRGVVEICSPD